MTSVMQCSAAYDNPMLTPDDEELLGIAPRQPALPPPSLRGSGSGSLASPAPPPPDVMDFPSLQTMSSSLSGECDNPPPDPAVEEEMRGFKVFLMATQLICLVVMASAVCVSHMTSSATAWPITIFFFLEQCVFVVAIIHACRPSIRMLLVFLSLDIAIAVAGIVLALVVVIKDGGKECDRDPCSTLHLAALERFHFFWFLLGKATFSLFFSLIAVAYSPQVHDYLADDECEQAIFQQSMN